MDATVDPFSPATLGPVRLRNRFIKAATFEGLTPGHVVTDRLIDFHAAMAAGGVAMTTVAYCAISQEGCGTPNEIVLTPNALPGLSRLADAVHAHHAAVSCQIGHAGAVAAATGHRGRSPSPLFSPLAMKRTRPLDGDDIRKVVSDFSQAARVVADAGFDAVEVHLGHGYLLSEFLSPGLNKRTDTWGGSLANRARLPREVLGAVRGHVGSSVAVIAKINMVDGVKEGLGLDESIEVGRMIESDGSVDALVLSAGSSLQNPMFLLRGDAPVKEMAESFRQPVRSAVRIFGRRFLRSYPFEEAYLLPLARQFRAALTIPLVLLGGINRLDTVQAALAEGFEFVALGRALLREPDLVERFGQRASVASACIHCNKCIPTIYRGTHCVLVPEEERPGRAPTTLR